MPYKDPEKQRAYMRSLMRKRNKEKKREIETKRKLEIAFSNLEQNWWEKALSHVRQDPDYLKLTENEKAALEQQLRTSFLNQSDAFFQQLMDQLKEAELYARARIPSIIDEAIAQVEQEQKAKIESELRRILKPIIELPEPQRQAVIDRLFELLEIKTQKALAVTVAQKEQT